jgi:hypothetical protein
MEKSRYRIRDGKIQIRDRKILIRDGKIQIRDPGKTSRIRNTGVYCLRCLIFFFKNLNFCIAGLSWHPGGKYLLSASDDKTLRKARYHSTS